MPKCEPMRAQDRSKMIQHGPTWANILQHTVLQHRALWSQNDSMGPPLDPKGCCVDFTRRHFHWKTHGILRFWKSSLLRFGTRLHLMRALWAILIPSWCHLGTSWVHLGCILGSPGAILGSCKGIWLHFGGALGPHWSYLRPSWNPLAHLVGILAIWLSFCSILAPFGAPWLHLRSFLDHSRPHLSTQKRLLHQLVASVNTSVDLFSLNRCYYFPVFLLSLYSPLYCCLCVCSCVFLILVIILRILVRLVLLRSSCFANNFLPIVSAFWFSHFPPLPLSCFLLFLLFLRLALLALSFPRLPLIWFCPRTMVHRTWAGGIPWGITRGSTHLKSSYILAK